MSPRPGLGFGWLGRAVAGLRRARSAERPVLFLTTAERGSQRSRTRPLHYTVERGVIVVAAAEPGRPQLPGWFLDLGEQPRARVRTAEWEFDVDAETVSADERDRLWPLVLVVYPEYAEVQRHTTWAIPLVRLRRVGEFLRSVEPRGPTA